MGINNRYFSESCRY